MPNWIYTQGHLGWPVFTILAYAGLGVLVTDYVWRRVTIPAKVLLGVVVAIWLLGLFLLAVLF